jgi:hypothetical protein
MSILNRIARGKPELCLGMTDGSEFRSPANEMRNVGSGALPGTKHFAGEIATKKSNGSSVCSGSTSKAAATPKLIEGLVPHK